jgi:hypothetical protein
MLEPAGGFPAGSDPGADRRGPRTRGERGMVTAELAFASMGAALACVLLAWVLALVGMILRCQETAVEVARQEARGDRVAVARALTDRPRGAVVTVRHDGARVRVRVELAARPWADWLPSVPLAVAATVLQEPA